MGDPLSSVRSSPNDLPKSEHEEANSGQIEHDTHDIGSSNCATNQGRAAGVGVWRLYPRFVFMVFPFSQPKKKRPAR